MRGKRSFQLPIIRSIRITPADAGKTNGAGSPEGKTGDHPRGCGENIQQECSTCGQIGSPPRMRGKHTATTSIYSSFRITPADAGKTGRYIFQLCKAEDHPRGCGENSRTSAAVGAALGSPPRMRGKLSQVLQGIGEVRITPADAGKTAPGTCKH